MRTYDKQKIIRPEWNGKKPLECRRECKKCGKFSRPVNRKRLTYWDTHCRNCGTCIDCG